MSLDSLLELLGWEIAKGAKRLPFDKQFMSLGVKVELPKRVSREPVLFNKPGRVEAIRKAVKSVFDEPKPFGFKDALSFKGRIAYAEGQTFGRVLAPVSRVLSRWESEARSRLPTEELGLALASAADHLEHAGPRRIGPRRS